MDKTSIKSLTVGILGIVTTASLGITQEAQAGTIQAESQLQFSNVRVTLQNRTLLPIFLQQTDALAQLNGTTVFDNDGPFRAPVTVTSSAEVNQPPSIAQGGATVNNPSNVARAGNSAFLQLLNPLGGELGRGEGGYQAFTGSFRANRGNTLNLTALFEPFLQVQVTDYDPGELKIARADYLAQFTLNEILTNGQAVPILTAPVLNNALSLVNQNGINTFNNSVPNFALDNPFDANINIPFVIPARLPGSSGTYTIGFNAVSRVSGQTSEQVVTPVPEPSSLVGLAAIGFGVLVSRQKRKQNTAN